MTTPDGGEAPAASDTSAELQHLTRWQKTTLVGGAVLRTVVGLALIGWMMTLVPDDPSGNMALPAVVAILITAGYIWFFKHQLSRVAKARYPMIRAAEALIMVAAMFLAVFAISYIEISQADTAAFTEPLDGFTAYYFSLTVLATVGFGDIAPVSGVARLVASAQMVLDLVVIGLVVRILFNAAQQGMSRRDPQPE